MKCAECKDYKECRRNSDLRRKRRRCSKAKDVYVLTNGDRIRAMSDEELADRLFALYRATTEEQAFSDLAMKWCDGNAGCIDEQGNIECDEERHKACILRWLQQPAEDGDGNGTAQT